MTNEVEIHGFKGKEVFTELVGEFTYTFFTIDKIFNVSICDEKNISKMSSKVKELVDELKNDRKKYNEYITNLSYNLFFYGMYYTIIDFQHPERTELGEAIKNIAFQLNIPTGKGSFSNYVKSRTFDIQVLGSGLTYPLFEGHSDFLGHYFRHLFQMVKYVSSLDNSLYKEEDKEGYVKILRSQMSDYEQILLYYNSLSEQGSAWNKTHGIRFPEDAGYISRYRMIKNLPPNFPVFGVIPYELYKKEAEKWEKRGKKFYEHKCLLISKSALDNKR